MLEPRRLQMLAAMGLTTWQLRKPGCLHWQGELPAIATTGEPVVDADAGTAPLAVVAVPDVVQQTAPAAEPQTVPDIRPPAQPCLGIVGPAPAWLGDLQLFLASAGIRVEAQPPQAGWGRLLMQPPASEADGWSGVELPGYAGKRAVWQALCASGWLHD